MDLGGWLRSLGLDRYEAAFRENAIDADVLCDLTDQDLEKLSVLLGHRRRILRAIAAQDDILAPTTASQAAPLAREQEPTAATLETHFEAPAAGEGGHVTVMFCGLVDSSGPSPNPDSEEWPGLVDTFLQAASIAGPTPKLLPLRDEPRSKCQKMMTGELAPARHIPSAATFAGNRGQIGQ